MIVWQLVGSRGRGESRPATSNEISCLAFGKCLRKRVKGRSNLFVALFWIRISVSTVLLKTNSWATGILKLPTVCRMRTTPVLFNPPRGMVPPLLTRVSQSFGLQTQSICNVPGKKIFISGRMSWWRRRGRKARRMAIKLWAIFQICRGRPSTAWAWRGAWRPLNVVAFQVDNITVSVNHMRILQVLRQVNALWPDLGDPTEGTRKTLPVRPATTGGHCVVGHVKKWLMIIFRRAACARDLTWGMVRQGLGKGNTVLLFS